MLALTCKLFVSVRFLRASSDRTTLERASWPGLTRTGSAPARQDQEPGRRRLQAVHEPGAPGGADERRRVGATAGAATRTRGREGARPCRGPPRREPAGCTGPTRRGQGAAGGSRPGRTGLDGGAPSLHPARQRHPRRGTGPGLLRNAGRCRCRGVRGRESRTTGTSSGSSSRPRTRRRSATLRATRAT